MAPRLRVAVISAGRVGSALAYCLHSAGHHVVGLVARSQTRRVQLREELPFLPDNCVITDNIATAIRGNSEDQSAQLLVLAVPDDALEAVVQQVEPLIQPGMIVMHTAGGVGRQALDRLTLAGAMTFAAHPVMSFVGPAKYDADQLEGCAWGVTAGDQVSQTVAELLISELGGYAVAVPEQSRMLYHAAMAHGSNHLGAVIADAVDTLALALAEPNHAHPSNSPAEPTTTNTTNTKPTEEQRLLAAQLMRGLCEASLTNVLQRGEAGLSGPVVRGDKKRVAEHLAAIEADAPQIEGSYVQLARRIAQRKRQAEILELLQQYY